MTDERPLVVVVIDDDRSVRESLPELLREMGFEVRTFASAESFLAAGDFAGAACVLLDVSMPGATGLDLLDQMYLRGMQVPVVLMTAHTSDAYRRRLLESRAEACLFKPFSEAELIHAINLAARHNPGARGET